MAALVTLREDQVYQAEMEETAEMVGDQVKLKLILNSHHNRVSYFFFLSFKRLTYLSNNCQ